MAAWNLFSYNCTRAHHSFLYFAHCPLASTVIPLLPKATFTPSIQPNLDLPRTRPPLISTISTFLAIRTHPFLPHTQTAKPSQYSLIRSTQSTLPFYSSSPKHLFIPNSIHLWQYNQTSQTLHVKNIHFPSLRTSHIPCCTVQRHWYNYYYCTNAAMQGRNARPQCKGHKAATLSIQRPQPHTTNPWKEKKDKIVGDKKERADHANRNEAPTKKKEAHASTACTAAIAVSKQSYIRSSRSVLRCRLNM